MILAKSIFCENCIVSKVSLEPQGRAQFGISEWQGVSRV